MEATFRILAGYMIAIFILQKGSYALGAVSDLLVFDGGPNLIEVHCFSLAFPIMLCGFTKLAYSGVAVEAPPCFRIANDVYPGPALRAQDTGLIHYFVCELAEVVEVHPFLEVVLANLRLAFNLRTSKIL